MKRIVIIGGILLILLIILCGKTYAMSDLSLNAKNAILIERKCKRVLYEKNAYERVPNASTTKMLTAIVVVENCDINEIVEIGQNAINVIGSKVRFRKGDKVTVNDLLNGMLLCSGNDAAVALAEHVAGSVDAFCEKMNEKAKEIGAYDTHFVTPHGLDEEEHYSTAYDLALIADYALNIPYLAKIFAKKTEMILINGMPREIHTTNEMLHVYGNADGVKTGFTNNAGRCLVTSATNENGWQLICVVLGCDTKNFRTQDSKKLLDYGFENFEFVNIAEILPKKIIMEVEKSIEQRYQIEINYNYLYPLTEEEKKKIHYEQTEILKMVAPVEQNTEIVQYTIFLEEKEITKFSLRLKEKIERKDSTFYFQELLENFAKTLNL